MISLTLPDNSSEDLSEIYTQEEIDAMDGEVDKTLFSLPVLDYSVLFDSQPGLLIDYEFKEVYEIEQLGEGYVWIRDLDDEDCSLCGYREDIDCETGLCVEASQVTILWLMLTKPDGKDFGLWLYDGGFEQVFGFGYTLGEPSGSYNVDYCNQVLEGGMSPTNQYYDVEHCLEKWDYYLPMVIQATTSIEAYTNDTVNTIVNSDAFLDAVRRLSGNPNWG